MPTAIVFRGEPASVHVVAGYLRASGMSLVGVIPPTPYLVGPLRQGMVRVMSDPAQASRLLDEARLDRLPPARTCAWWERLLAVYLLIAAILIGF